MHRQAITSSFLFLLTLAVFCATPAIAESESAAATGSGDPAGPAEVPREVRTGIEEALKGRVRELLDEKNDQGLSYKRGFYSKTFRPAGDGSYKATFHVDTALEKTWKTERFLLTLNKNDTDGTWTIGNEELQDTYSDLHRVSFDDFEFARFGRFSFEREGLRVESGAGSLYTIIRSGRLEGLRVVADGIRYAYVPPMEIHRPRYEKLSRDHPDDVIFTPDMIRITCDPESCSQMLRLFEGLSPTDLAGIDEPLRESYEDSLESFQDDIKESYFRHFYPTSRKDKRNWRLELRSGTKKRIALSYDNEQQKEMRFSAYGVYETFPGWETLYAWHSEATRNSGRDPIELERRDSANRRDYDLESLVGTIEMALEDAENMSADLSFGMTIKRDLRRLPFYIARLTPIRQDQKESKQPKMFVNSIQDGEGNDLTFVKLSPFFGFVVFPETQTAGEKIRLRAQFENSGAIYKFTPSFSYVSRGGWLPFVHFGDMIEEFDLTIKVPERYKTLGIGQKVEERVEDDVNVTRWVSPFPIMFPSVIFGDYLEASSTVKAVKKDGTEIPVAVHVDKAGRAQWDISPKSLEAMANEAANALNFFREFFDVDYPFDKLDIVNDPLGGLYGQAPSSLIYIGSAGFWSKGRLGSLDLGRGDVNLAEFSKELIAHEIGHQWWGHLVSMANFENYWFVESLAEYAAALFEEAYYGPSHYLRHVERWRREIEDTDLEVSVQEATHMWGGDGFGGYRAALYSKGPYAFHILRSMFRDPRLGPERQDERFISVMRHITRELAGKEVVTRDIQRAAEKACGTGPDGRPCAYNLEWFFDQWIRGVGMPELTFTWRVRETEDGNYLVEGHVDQRVLLGREKDSLPGEFFTGVVPITVEYKGGKEAVIPFRVNPEERTPFRFKLAERPKDVVLNKYGELLAYDVRKGS